MVASLSSAGSRSEYPFDTSASTFTCLVWFKDNPNSSQGHDWQMEEMGKVIQIANQQMPIMQVQHPHDSSCSKPFLFVVRLNYAFVLGRVASCIFGICCCFRPPLL